MFLINNLKNFIHIFSLVVVLICCVVTIELEASESSGKKIPNHEWSFEWFTGKFDKIHVRKS